MSEWLHLQLLSQQQDIIPPNARAIFLGDGEFNGIELQATLQTVGLLYVCHTAKNTQLYEDDQLFSFSDLLVQSDDLVSVPNVWFTKGSYGPVTVIAWWEKGYAEPIFLSPISICRMPPVTGTKSASRFKPSSPTRKAAVFTSTKVIFPIPNGWIPCWSPLAWPTCGSPTWA